jgi:hypothetical protein
MSPSGSNWNPDIVVYDPPTARPLFYPAVSRELADPNRDKFTDTTSSENYTNDVDKAL